MARWKTAVALFAALIALVAGAVPAVAASPPPLGRVVLGFNCAVADAPTARMALGPACMAVPPDAERRWVWLRIDDPRVVARLAHRFDLLSDYTRTRRMVVAVALADGRILEHRAASGAMEPFTTIGGHYRFGFDVGDVAVRAVLIGFDRNPDFGSMRKLELRATADVVRLERVWLLVVGLFVGALASVLPLPLFFRSRMRGRFELWYALWLCAGLAYGIVATGLIFWAVPEFAGIWSVRANYLLAGLTVGLSLFFLTAFFEPWALDRRVRFAVDATGVAVILGGTAGALDMLVPAALGDLAFNLAALTAPVMILIALTTALRRRSRAAWFYAVAWAAPLFVFMMRLARNFGFADSSDLVDMATFGALALECVLLSSAIADIHNRVRRERDAANAERAGLVRLAETDMLSGLLNRRGFVARAESALAAGRPVGLLLLDLDHFKRINDGWGHDAGDRVIERLGRILSRRLDGQGVLARVGGEEFAMLVTPTNGARGLIVCGERLRAAIASLSIADICPAHPGLTVSLGIAMANPGDDFPALYRAADRALYLAKAAGRDRAVFDRPHGKVVAFG